MQNLWNDVENKIKNKERFQYGCKKCDDIGKIYLDKPDGSFGKIAEICSCAVEADNLNIVLDLYKYSNIPFRLIRSYKFKNWKKPNKVLFEDIMDIIDGEDLGKNWFYIYGNSGSGKTYLAILIAKLALLREKQVFYIKVSDFLEQLRPNGYDEYKDLLSRCKNADILILDDIGHEKVTDWVRERLFSLISHRWDIGKPTIFTSNFSMENIKEKINEAAYSRIKDEAWGIALNTKKDKRFN